MSGTSHPFGKDWSLDRYLELGPSTVIDVGAGSGTYARLFRPQLEAHWTAVEVHEPYIDRYQLRDLYDEVLCRDIRDGVPTCDLLIAGDVIEHMPKADGIEVIRQAMRNCRALLLSLPLGRYDQGPIDGNDHETHLATWEHDEVADLLPGAECVVGDVLGVYLWAR